MSVIQVGGFAFVASEMQAIEVEDADVIVYIKGVENGFCWTFDDDPNRDEDGDKEAAINAAAEAVVQLKAYHDLLLRR